VLYEDDGLEGCGTAYSDGCLLALCRNMEMCRVSVMQPGHFQYLYRSQAYSHALKLRGACASETSVNSYQTTLRYIPEECTLKAI
jgi:hypothetical protein